MKQSVHSQGAPEARADPAAHVDVEAREIRMVPRIHWLAGAALQNAVALADPADTKSPPHKTMLALEVIQTAYLLACPEPTVDIPEAPIAKPLVVPAVE